MKENLKQPFFATLLESQNRTPIPEDQLWPWPGTTPIKDNLHTHKYPSDDDEEGEPI